MGTINDVATVLAGERPQDGRGQLNGVFRGIVTTRTATELSFVIPAIDGVTEFGPAPYPRPASTLTTSSESGGSGDDAFAAHTHTVDPTPVNLPPKGTVIAVAFGGDDPDEPLVLAIYGWPA